MKLITRQTQATEELLRWRESKINNGIHLLLRTAALAAPDNATPEQVEAIRAAADRAMGWHVSPILTQSCDECSGTAYPFVRVGQEPDYESSTATVCLPCLRRAVALAEEGT